MRDSFVFYRSFFEAIEIQPKNVQADIYAAIFDYVFNDKLPEGLTSIAQSMFILIISTHTPHARRDKQFVCC